MNKYEIVSGCFEGSTGYKTINDLIEGYNRCKDKTLRGRICLTCEYLNSLYWETRDSQEEKDYRELNNELISYGIYNDFVMMMSK